MATVVVSPLAQTHFPMSNRRTPLGDLPNAANSPRLAAPLVTKRARSYAQDQREAEYGQQPAFKKQLLDFQSNDARRTYPISTNDTEGHVFLGALNHAEKTEFQKRLDVVQTRPADARRHQPSKTQKPNQEDIETIKQWRKHQMKVFPTYVFYFESMSQEACITRSRLISKLHAKEEKFFSKAVTHIVTTRPIPTSPPQQNNAELHLAKVSPQEIPSSQVRTINPSLLDKSAEAHLSSLQKKAKQASPHKKPVQSNNNDILHKAQQLKIKIWALEKFDRMMEAMFDQGIMGEGQNTRHNSKSTLVPLKRAGDADLSQLLRNEKLNVNVEKAAISDVVQLKGYYIYIHDMDEKTRPVMIREYGKPRCDQDGDWPQFRSVSNGRCPFVEEACSEKREDQREKEKKIQRETPDAQSQMPRTRSVAATEMTRNQNFADSQKKEPLRELDHNSKCIANTMPAPVSKAFAPPKLKTLASGSMDSMPPMLGSTWASYRGLVGKPGGEPIASGVQPSNITSAIRSQMVSSTAAAPGARAGTSKEAHQLQRRILERNSGLSAGSVPSSYINDVRAAINNEPPPAPRRATRQRAETLTRIQEDDATTDMEQDGHTAQANVSGAPKKKRSTRRDPKPGYCENCRDKYDDFNEHVQSRKHRHFANAAENWTELDSLLRLLARPLKEQPIEN